MREIFLVSDDSTESSLVFSTTAEGGAEEFFFVVTPELKAVLLASDDKSAEPANSLEIITDSSAEDLAPAKNQVEVNLDPRLSAPLTMSPRDIQVRIRAGATVSDLAAEIGVTESRIEPFAHPVLLERARIAELAKQSHPVRENGPAKLTLWEILATAFATRGHDLSTATWDAYRDAANRWIVRVDWKAGLSDNHAEWALTIHNTSSPTADPCTPVAADLIDPEFIQPVRTLTSIGGNHYLDEDEDNNVEDDVPTTEIPTADDQVQPENLDQAPKNRRRKAVTPHWEDVLLGVRANTKRPKK